ncbi:MAG TPA: hypothetical protein VF622_18095 [Segetibacter sp.]|jgi:CMP-N-acetylneuraminate monooxygenase
MLKKVGTLAQSVISTDTVSINTNQLPDGFHSSDDFIFEKKDGQIKYVINRICDHNGGKLIQQNNIATCPLHNWTLNLDTLHYNESFIKKEAIDFKIDQEGNLLIEQPKYILKMDVENKPNVERPDIEVYFLSHASIFIKVGDFGFMTDPWLLGPAFMTGWWLLHPPKAFAIECIKNTSLLFVSHNHPDHLHPETLKLFDKNILVITADFNSRSSEKMLKRTGFKNVIPLPFKDVFQWNNEQIFLSVLKSGDFRDDSGLYMSLYGFEILLTVDANFINGFILPCNIQLLLTSFASGASGYPICYDEMITNKEQQRILKRNRSAALLKLGEIVKRTKPGYYIPYAGYFKEKAKRDEGICNNNVKNSYDNVTSYLDKQKLNTTVLNPLEFDHFTFKADGTLVQNHVNGPNLYNEEQEYFDSYIKSYQQEYFLKDGMVEEYFREASFRDNLQLFLVPTNDDFNPLPEGYMIDFSTPELVCSKLDVGQIDELYNTPSIKRKEYIWVRTEVVACIIINRLPWEDMSIGFQCRFKRNPDIYNAAFWHYFTNVHVGDENFRYDSYCGGLCTKLEQNTSLI